MIELPSFESPTPRNGPTLPESKRRTPIPFRSLPLCPKLLDPKLLLPKLDPLCVPESPVVPGLVPATALSRHLSSLYSPVVPVPVVLRRPKERLPPVVPPVVAS